MATTAPNFNSLASLFTEIWRGSQNKKWELLIPPVADAEGAMAHAPPPSVSTTDQGRLLMGGMGDGSPTISKMGGCHERITLNHHFVRRPLLPLLGLFTSVYAPTSIPPTVPESDIMVIDNKNL